MQESLFQHFWTQYVPEPKPERARGDPAQHQPHGKGGGKDGGRDRAQGGGDRLAHIQKTKDREIASLKRQLADKPSSQQPYDSKKQRYGKGGNSRWK